MKSYNNLDELLYDEHGLEEDFRRTSNGRKKRPQVLEVRRDLEKHKAILRDQLKHNTFTREIHSHERINEGSRRKTRDIQKPAYLYEQPAHHALIRVIKPAIMESMYLISCSSIEGRGAHYGKRFIEKWIRNDPKNCKYVLKFDIRHFFESVSHRRLKKMLKKKIRDKEILKKLFTVIDSCDKGIPIGYYTSQWFGNMYLTPLDHFIKERLHAKHYIRYADDCVIFGRNKKELHAMRREISKYLKEELGIRMKKNWQVFRFSYTNRAGKECGRPLDFMGFKFYRNRTTIRKSILKRIRKKANQIKRKGKVTWKDAASMLSRMGYITHSDTYGYYERYIKPFVKIKALKKLVSKHKRRENEKWSISKEKAHRRKGRKNWTPQAAAIQSTSEGTSARKRRKKA